MYFYLVDSQNVFDHDFCSTCIECPMSFSRKVRLATPPYSELLRLVSWSQHKQKSRTAIYVCTYLSQLSTHTLWLETFPALVGNKRMHGRCGCKLVITSQEIALLLLPDSEDEGTPARWRRSSNILTPSHLAGVREEEQSHFAQSAFF